LNLYGEFQAGNAVLMIFLVRLDFEVLLSLKFMSTVEQRPLSVGDIEYIYIPKERQNVPSVISPPKDFNNQVLSFVRALPKNLIQLNDPFVYYGNRKFVQSDSPHHFVVIYPDSIDFFIHHNPYKDSIKVFIVHPDTPEINDIITTLRAQFFIIFLIRVDFPKEPISGFEEICILSPDDFLSKLKSKREMINKLLLASFPKQQIDFEVDLPLTELHKKYDTSSTFQASHTNYWTLNQVLGIYWAEPHATETTEELISSVDNPFAKDRNDSYRLQILFNQLDKIDELEMLVLEDRGVKFPNDKYDWISPLIIVIPFNFPTLGKLLDPSLNPKEVRRIVRSLSYEQSINYVSYAQTDQATADDFMAHGKVTAAKTRYLDGVAYLHASFTMSPVLRFPLLGNSIKRNLSFFQPNKINWKNFINSKELIDSFGVKLSQLILPGAFSENAFGLPRQIVALTDLPVEWLVHGGLNLCLTHDITRIPEMPYSGILASFNVNSHFQFRIREDILTRTLVILGAGEQEGVDEEFKTYFRYIEKFSKELNFKTARCTSLNEVVAEINSQKPDLLIFDCHGGYDQDTLSSYLLINGQKITGDDIVRHSLVAPLVFLSACHTNPNYGYVNKIADAFFEAGCFALTATYFPISVHGGTNIYYRLLSNLNHAAKMAVHKNWLGFVCHTIRTSWFKEVCYECMRRVAASGLDQRKKKNILKDLRKLNKDTTLFMLRQDRRADVFRSFEAKLKAIVSDTIFDYRSIIPEYCFYTNMGRGDLIKFDSWQKEFDNLNGFTNRRQPVHDGIEF
jgi:hypothetical protein